MSKIRSVVNSNLRHFFKMILLEFPHTVSTPEGQRAKIITLDKSITNPGTAGPVQILEDLSLLQKVFSVHRTSPVATWIGVGLLRTYTDNSGQTKTLAANNLLTRDYRARQGH